MVPISNDGCHVGSATGAVPLLSRPSVALPAPQEWYIGRWPSGPVVASIESIRKQPGQVLGNVNSLAISKCRWLPELIRATVPLAGSDEEAGDAGAAGAQADAIRDEGGVQGAEGSSWQRLRHPSRKAGAVHRARQACASGSSPVGAGAGGGGCVVGVWWPCAESL